jgi:protein ImuA
VILVEVNRPVDVLWALEEALRCRALSMAIGEVWGQPKALDFTASTRLALRSERYGVPCWLIRRAAAPDLSAARSRWRVGALPSTAHGHDAGAPGDPRWRLTLFRTRDAQPGTWVATHDRAANRVDLLAASGDGAVAEDHGADRRRAAR